MGLKNKLFVWTSLAIFAAGILLAYLVLPEVEAIVHQKTIRVMQLETKNVASKMDEWLTDRFSILETVAWQIERNGLDGDQRQLSEFMDAAAGRFDNKFGYLYIGFADKSFKSTRKSTPPPNYDPTSRLWYKNATSQKALVVTEPYPDIRTGKFNLSIALPVRTTKPGAIATDLHLDDLERLAKTAVFHPLAKVMLISRAGMLLYSTDDSFGQPGDIIGFTSEKLFQQRLYQAMLEEDRARFEKDGELFRIQSARVPSSGWTVAVILPDSVFQVEARKILTYIIGSMLVCLALISFSIYFVFSEITKPLQALSAVASELGAGNLQAAFSPVGTKEVRRLSQSLDSMRVKIINHLEEKDSLLEETRAQNDEINALYGQMKALNETLLQAYRENDSAYMQTVKALADSIEAKDYYTRGHSDRVLNYAEVIAKALGWNDEQLRVIRFAAILHDIGKIGVPLEILNKPGALTSDEFEIVKAHPVVGFKIIKNIDYLSLVSDVVLQHHERVDGLGYPKGLKGDAILPYAKVLSVADAFDAMTSERPYKKPLTRREALAELVCCSGTQFDSEIVNVFCKASPELIKEL